MLKSSFMTNYSLFYFVPIKISC